MTKLTLFVLTVLVSTSLSAQSVFFPTQPGTVILHQQTDADGNVTGYQRHTITSVSGSDSNMTIEYLIENMDENWQVTLEIPGITHVRDGRMIFDIEQMIAPHLHRAGMELDVEFEGTFMEMPVSFSPGQRFPDTEGTIRIGRGVLGMRVRMSVTDASCLAIEEVDVPAGTFTAHQITQTINSTVLMRTTRTRLVSWMVPGIGTVKSRTYDNRDRLQSVSKLVEISRP